MSYVTGELIRNLRRKRGITQREFAEIINVSDKTVSKWETEKGSWIFICLLQPLRHGSKAGLEEAGKERFFN